MVCMMDNLAKQHCGVVVAVRVRPMMEHERKLESGYIVQADSGKEISITDPVSLKFAVEGRAKNGSASISAYLQSNEEEGRKLRSQFTRRFAFDHVFDSSGGSDGTQGKVSQSYIMGTLGTYLLDNAFEGYNCSVLAYGQTGAGKSYTMMGSGDGIVKNMPEEERGLIPRCGVEIFNRIERENREEKNGSCVLRTNCRVACSYIEIYNENVRDLFQEVDDVVSSTKRRVGKAKPNSLKIRENPSNGIFIEGLKIVEVTSYEELEEKLLRGSESRAVAQTKMNQSSSRSHAILTVYLQQRTEQHDILPSGCVREDGSLLVEKLSKIHMVDLAGSERVANSGAVGDRLREAVNINTSLSSLGMVITALVDKEELLEVEKKKGGTTRRRRRGSMTAHIPYRNSKLTYLLKDSLGGNAKAIMIAAISPASPFYETTLSTLKFVERAKKMRVHAKVNVRETDSAKVIKELREEIRKLKEQLSIATQDDPRAGQLLSQVSADMQEREAKIVELERQNSSMESSLDSILHSTLDSPDNNDESEGLQHEMPRSAEELKELHKHLSTRLSKSKSILRKNDDEQRLLLSMLQDCEYVSDHSCDGKEEGDQGENEASVEQICPEPKPTKELTRSDSSHMRGQQKINAYIANVSSQEKLNSDNQALTGRTRRSSSFARGHVLVERYLHQAHVGTESHIEPLKRSESAQNRGGMRVREYMDHANVPFNNAANRACHASKQFWKYIDTEGNEQGPFSGKEMEKWLQQKLLPRDLLVAQYSTDSTVNTIQFVKLQDLLVENANIFSQDSTGAYRDAMAGSQETSRSLATEDLRVPDPSDSVEINAEKITELEEMIKTHEAANAEVAIKNKLLREELVRTKMLRSEKRSLMESNDAMARTLEETQRALQREEKEAILRGQRVRTLEAESTEKDKMNKLMEEKLLTFRTKAMQLDMQREIAQQTKKKLEAEAKKASELQSKLAEEYLSSQKASLELNRLRQKMLEEQKRSGQLERELEEAQEKLEHGFTNGAKNNVPSNLNSSHVEAEPSTGADEIRPSHNQNFHTSTPEGNVHLSPGRLENHSSEPKMPANVYQKLLSLGFGMQVIDWESEEISGFTLTTGPRGKEFPENETRNAPS